MNRIRAKGARLSVPARSGADSPTVRLREAQARRRLEELREDRLLRQRIGDIFGDESG